MMSFGTELGIMLHNVHQEIYAGIGRDMKIFMFNILMFFMLAYHALTVTIIPLLFVFYIAYSFGMSSSPAMDLVVIFSILVALMIFIIMMIVLYAKISRSSMGLIIYRWKTKLQETDYGRDRIISL